MQMLTASLCSHSPLCRPRYIRPSPDYFDVKHFKNCHYRNSLNYLNTFGMQTLHIHLKWSYRVKWWLTQTGCPLYKVPFTFKLRNLYCVSGNLIDKLSININISNLFFIKRVKQKVNFVWRLHNNPEQLDYTIKVITGSMLDFGNLGILGIPYQEWVRLINKDF